MVTDTVSIFKNSANKEIFMNRLSGFFSAITLIAGVALIAPVASAQTHNHAKHASMSSGEITKIDKDSEKITIKHGPLANLNMPGMTMAFKVKNAAMLDQVKSGDKISFIAEKVNGALVVTALAPVK